MNDCYSPHTGEHIRTDNPADWTGRAGAPAPDYDTQTAGAFWRGERWEIIDVLPALEPVPPVVSMRQARLALHAAGFLDAVNAAVAAMPGAEGASARIEWEYAQEVRRDSPLVRGLADALGLGDEQLDGLFISAVMM
jgi:hypothetical protein